MTEIHQLVTVSEAKAIWQKNFCPGEMDTETLPLEAVLGRVLARNILAPEDLPGFARSTVDGFAVRARDTFGASESLPAYLHVVGDILMGQSPGRDINPGEAMGIATGAMLPQGADGVVMVEYTQELDSHNIEVVRPIAPGENIVIKGEDIREGQPLLGMGHLLRPQDIGVLAGMGITEVAVRRQPVVGIISTGDELVAPQENPQPGQVRDINSYTLAGLVAEAGGKPRLYGILRDTFEELDQAVSLALKENDIVVLSGGSSVGTKDNTARVIQTLGEPGVLVHGISIKPGKPTILGLVGNKPVYGLPGHPASAMVIFDLFIKPVIRQLMGLAQEPFQVKVQARFGRNMASASGREDYLRVALVAKDGELWAEPILGKSGLISTMVKADGIVKVAETKEGLTTGERVEVIIF